MVRNYKRKTDRGKWDIKKMELAVKEVSSGQVSCKRASQTYDVPRSTLQRKVEEYKKNNQTFEMNGLGSFKPVFTSAQEEELASYIKDMESCFLAADTTDSPLVNDQDTLGAPHQLTSPSLQIQTATAAPASSGTSNAQPPTITDTQQSVYLSLESSVNTQSSTTLNPDSSMDLQLSATHGPAALMAVQPPVTPPPGPSSAFKVLTPSNILPIPKASRQKRVTRKRGKTAIITSSPYKAELEQSKPKPKNVNKVVKKQKKGKNGKENCADDEDVECLYCGEWYSQSKEGWISCRACKRWAHCSCAGEDDNDDESLHICSFCARF